MSTSMTLSEYAQMNFGKETLFDDKLLWFGACVALCAFVVEIVTHPEPHTVLSVFGFAVVGAVMGVLAQVLFTVMLSPFAWWQMYRLHYHFSATHSALILTAALLIGALFAGAALWLLSFDVVQNIYGLITLITFPFAIAAAYVEMVARNKIPFYRTPTNKQIVRR